MSEKIRVAVLFGGASGEHEVSLVSAASIMDALSKEKYETLPVGITKEGRWFTGGDPLQILRMGESDGVTERAFMSPDPAMKGIVVLREAGGNELAFDRFIPVDVIFPVLHGPFGEDGTVQGLFELSRIPYVGAGVLASSCGMDKIVMKKLFREAGLPVAEGVAFTRNEWKERGIEIMVRLEEELGYDFFIKPANLGSSVGISKAHNREELTRGIDEACTFDFRVLVEKAVPLAREVECSVLGNESPLASVPGEIIPCNEFYDYEAKYIAGKSQTLAPADLPAEVSEKIRDLSVRAFKALQCEGMARVDFLVEKLSHRICLNELNTIPGFTSISMYPKLWAASGVCYPDLIDRLINLAFERTAEKEKTLTSMALESDWYKK
ncbi:MAG: D-alanine--D-alanine ligase family protein [Candidatus Eremiobacteraeota bacterium]|nr:D-alanine--D-alanine ligase family protein [Candidatus Eremiobacteraeota bacterium]